MRGIRTVLAVLACVVVLPVASASAASAQGGLIERLNQIRAGQGLSALRPSQSLLRSSRAYAGAMMRSDWFGHQASLPVSSRFRLAGETLEWHSGWRLSPARVVQQWMSSPPHRALLLSDRFSRIGVGHARGLYGGRRATMWVAHLGRL